MLTFLQQLDADIFLRLNGLHASWLDPVMAMVSNKWVWVPFYIFLVYLVSRRCNWKQTLACIAMIALAVALADQCCASLLRPIFCRPRPANPDSPICELVHIVNGYRGGHYGFPSCHASNSAALAIFMILFFKRRWATILFLAWMLLLCYSRIYLGVHYPGDLLVGMVIGGCFGAICYWIFSMLRNFPLFADNSNPKDSLE